MKIFFKKNAYGACQEQKTLYFCTRFRERAGSEDELGEISSEDGGWEVKQPPVRKKMKKVLGGNGKRITFAVRFREEKDSRDGGEVL